MISDIKREMTFFWATEMLYACEHFPNWQFHLFEPSYIFVRQSAGNFNYVPLANLIVAGESKCCPLLWSVTR